MKLRQLAQLAGWLVYSLAMSSAASASFVWHEQSGTHSLTSTAQTVIDTASNPLSGIVGALGSVFPVGPNPVYEVDVYKIEISDYKGFSARTVSTNPVDDTALFLFDSAGLGVYMNDDESDSSLLSLLPAGDPNGPVNDGWYYLAVALGGVDAFADIANAIANFLSGSFTDVRAGDGTAGPLASWLAAFVSQAEGAFGYTIELTGAGTRASVPAPATLVLLLFGLAGAAASRRSAPGIRH